MRIRAINKQSGKVVYIVQILGIAQSGFICAYVEQDGTELKFASPGYFKIDDDEYKSKEETVDGHNTSTPTDRNNQGTN